MAWIGFWDNGEQTTKVRIFERGEFIRELRSERWQKLPDAEDDTFVFSPDGESANTQTIRILESDTRYPSDAIPVSDFFRLMLASARHP